MSEHMIRDLCAATTMKHVILRYFNVAGSDPDGKIGQSTPQATLLVKVACEAAMGKRDKLFISAPITTRLTVPACVIIFTSPISPPLTSMP